MTSPNADIIVIGAGPAGVVAALRAAELGARTVAFPAISAGIYGWPADDAARIAVRTVRANPRETIAEARFVLFSQDMYDEFERALAEEAS